MKELKALDIIKDLYSAKFEDGEFYTHSFLDEAIAELEALQYQLENNHKRAEEIIASREKDIRRLHSELDALQAPNTCNGCGCNGTIGCYGCFRHYNDLTDKFTPKAQQ